MANIMLTPDKKCVLDVFCAVLTDYHRSFPGTGVGAENVVESAEFEKYARDFFPKDLYPGFYGKYFASTFYQIVMHSDKFVPDEVATYMLLKMFESAGLDPLTCDIDCLDVAKLIEDVNTGSHTGAYQFRDDNMTFVSEEQFESLYRKIYFPKGNTYRYFMRLLPTRYRNQLKTFKNEEIIFQQIIQVRYR